MGRARTLVLGICLLVLLFCWALGLLLPSIPAAAFVVLAGAAGTLIGASLRPSGQEQPIATTAATATADTAQLDASEPLETIEAVSHPLETVEGIGPGYGTRLRDLGIPNTLALLEFGAVKARRLDLASHLRVEPLVVRRWTSMADLLRIPDLDAQSAEVLEAAGIQTVLKLAESNPVTLIGRLFEVNEKLRLTPGDLPSVDQMERWVGLARVLPRVVEDL